MHELTSSCRESRNIRVTRIALALALACAACSACSAAPSDSFGGCSEESMLICGFASNAVVRINPMSGQPLATIGGGSPLAAPLCARIGPDGLLYVASEATDQILRFDPCDGTFIDVFVQAGAGGLNAPTSVDWGADGNLYVAGFENDAVLKFDGTTGAFISIFVAAGAVGLNGPDNGTMFGPDGHLYVPGYYNNKIFKFDGRTGFYISTFVNPILKPRVLVWDGPDLLVTSESSDSVRRFNAATGAPNGNKVSPGAGGLDQPIGLAKGPDGDLYVSSGTQDRVYRFDGITGAFEQIVVPTGTPGVQAPLFITFVPVAPPMAEDLNSDGTVDGADLAILLGQWNGVGTGDLDGSGVVDGADLGMLLGAWS